MGLIGPLTVNSNRNIGSQVVNTPFKWYPSSFGLTCTVYAVCSGMCELSGPKPFMTINNDDANNEVLKLRIFYV